MAQNPNLLERLKTALNTAKSKIIEFFERNGNVIKKCALTAVCAFILGVSIGGSCRSPTAKADTYDVQTPTLICPYVNTLILSSPMPSSTSIPISLRVNLAFEIDFENDIVYYLYDSQRIDLSTSVNVPIQGDIYGSAQNNLSMTIESVIYNLTASDTYGNPTYTFSHENLNDLGGVLRLVNDITDTYVELYVVFYQNTTQLNVSTNSISVNPLFYLVESTGSYQDGYNAGLTVGYQNAINDGSAGGILESIANGITGLVSIEIFPGVPLSYLALIGFGLVALRIIMGLFGS